jgi:hypothetical protein
MRVIWLCWYLSGIQALLFVLASLITYGPGAESFEMMMLTMSGSGALVTAGLAILLSRLPPDHWIHQSRQLWAGLLAAAATLTIFVLSLG